MELMEGATQYYRRGYPRATQGNSSPNPMAPPTSDSDEDETLYYRYTTPTFPSTATQSKGSGSGGLAPSKSTLYISNLPFSLTNSDLHTILSSFGKIARVTILKDKTTRLSRGVAFVLFVSRDDATRAAKAVDGKVMEGRTLRAGIARDNGRAREFVRRRVYVDKSRCYECGEEGHLSYECPKNVLGKRERPKSEGKRRKRDGGGGGWTRRGGEEEMEEAEGGFEDENWASVVDDRADERLLMGGVEGGGGEGKRNGKKVKKASYFSDESGEEDD
ncbi:U11/U12 small nuclear ribonucleoprotein 31 kDa protein-like protein [Drosera capensis]